MVEKAGRYGGLPTLVEKVMKAGVYAIRCSVDGKVYVGSAIDVARRRVRHFSDLRRGRHANSKMQRAWNKYGEKTFLFEVLETCEPERLVAVEQKWIDALGACAGFNQRPDAASNLGFRHSEESRAKTSRSMSGSRNPFYGKVAWNRGVSPSTETRAKLSASLKALGRGADYFRALRANVEKTSHSEETKEKMRKPKSPEHAAKLRAILVARNRDPEVRAAQSARQTGVTNLNSLGKQYKRRAAPAAQ